VPIASWRERRGGSGRPNLAWYHKMDRGLVLDFQGTSP
jgi:hypothetical protein